MLWRLPLHLASRHTLREHNSLFFSLSRSRALAHRRFRVKGTQTWRSLPTRHGTG